MPRSVNYSAVFACVIGVFLAGSLARAEDDEAQKAKDARRVKALLRLSNVDLGAMPEAKASLVRYLAAKTGTEEYLQLVGRFQIREAQNELLKLALEKPDDALGVEAARLLLVFHDEKFLSAALEDKDDARAVRLILALGLTGDVKANEFLAPIVTLAERAVAVRTAAVTALGRNLPGQKLLLAVVVEGKLAADLQFAAANALLTSTDAGVKAEAAKHLKLPATADSKPLPPVAELVRQAGHVEEGRKLFATLGTCAKCHKVKGEGKEVGPDLSEIGSKLGKDALYISILDPSAGISHNYETHLFLLEDGSTLSGIIVSETAQQVDVKTAEALVRKLPVSEITSRKKQNISLMPADLQKTLTAQNLIDIVEYLTTLKKPAN